MPKTKEAVRPHILAVDDDERILKLIEVTLENHYRLSLYNSPQEALAALEEGLVPDLILCDIAMPGMSGFDLHEALRMHPALLRVPFVYLTAFDSSESFRQGMGLGADDYLTKPFRPHELVGALEIRLQRLEGLRAAGETLEIRSLGGLQMTLGGKALVWEVRKAATAFLYLLSEWEVANSGLKDALWSGSVDENSLYVLTLRLRKTIEPFAQLSSVGGRVHLKLEQPYRWDAQIFATLAYNALADKQALTLESAISHYRGVFLPDAEAPWAQTKRAELEALYLKLLEASIETAPNPTAERVARERLERFIS